MIYYDTDKIEEYYTDNDIICFKYKVNEVLTQTYICKGYEDFKKSIEKLSHHYFVDIKEEIYDVHKIPKNIYLDVGTIINNRYLIVDKRPYDIKVRVFDLYTGGLISCNHYNLIDLLPHMIASTDEKYLEFYLTKSKDINYISYKVEVE